MWEQKHSLWEHAEGHGRHVTVSMLQGMAKSYGHEGGPLKGGHLKELCCT